MDSQRPSLSGRSLQDLLSLAIMFARGFLYFIVRLRRPRLVLMGRGASIRGIGNIEFAGVVRIGAWAQIDARWCDRLTLGKYFSLGDFSILRCSGSHSFICPGVSIGDHTSFGPYCNIGGGYGLFIGHDCLFGPYVSIHPEYHLSSVISKPIRNQGIAGEGIRIGNDNWFGAKSTVLDGVEIGDGIIIGAAALVRKGRYSSNTKLAGIPAHIIGER